MALKLLICPKSTLDDLAARWLNKIISRFNVDSLFINDMAPAVLIGLDHGRPFDHGPLSVFKVHLDEAKAPATARDPIPHDYGIRDGAKSLKIFNKIGF